MSAADILNAALGHMQDRAATYDKPDGERSMGATVDAFTAVTGVCMTEEQGWLFMALLKAVRSQQGAYRADSYEDGAAYFALAGEAAVRDRTVKESFTVHPVHPAAFDHVDPADVDIASAIDDDSERMQAIGQNGNGGEHYRAPDWSKAPDNAVLYIDWTESAAGFASSFYCDGGDRFYRLHCGVRASTYVLKRDDGLPDTNYQYFMRPAN